MQEYSLADLKRLFGLPPALINKLSQAGFITLPAASNKGGKRSEEHTSELQSQ